MAIWGPDVAPNSARREPQPEPSEQCCFVCFDLPGRDTVAVKVSCRRPTKERESVGPRVFIGKKMEREVTKRKWRKPDVGEMRGGVECDIDVYERIRETYLAIAGVFFGRLPFYGVKEVREVEVRD